MADPKKQNPATAEPSPDPMNIGPASNGLRHRNGVQRLRRLAEMGPVEVSSFQQLTESRPPIQHQGARGIRQ